MVEGSVNLKKDENLGCKMPNTQTTYQALVCQ